MSESYGRLHCDQKWIKWTETHRATGVLDCQIKLAKKKSHPRAANPGCCEIWISNKDRSSRTTARSRSCTTSPSAIAAADKATASLRPKSAARLTSVQLRPPLSAGRASSASNYGQHSTAQPSRRSPQGSSISLHLPLADFDNAQHVSRSFFERTNGIDGSTTITWITASTRITRP